MSVRDGLATRAGGLVHLAARGVRRLGRRHTAQAPTGAPPRLAVLSDAFIRYGSAQAIGLREAGADVTFYYVDRLGEFDGNAADRAQYILRLKAAGIDAIPLPQRNMRRLASQVVQLHRDLRRRKIDALVVQAHIDPRYATLGLRFPVALLVHDPRPHSGDYASTYPAPVRAMARIAELTSSCVLLHSERLIPQLRPLLRRVPLGVVPHGAEPEDAAREITEPPVIALTGRLMEYKGIDVALEAFRTVAAARPDCRMVVAGRGRLGDKIRAASPEGVELRDRYIPEPEMQALLDASRLVLLPYLDATQSGVGLQAIARGVPCVVSDAGALPDLVPEGRDWVVPPGDSTALAAAILRALDHDDATRDALLRFASERFAWPAAAQRLLAELRRLRLVS